MRLFIFIAITFSIFSLGVIAGGLVQAMAGPIPAVTQVTFPQPQAELFPTQSFLYANPDISSPADHIEESAIEVYSDKVILNIANPQWARFTDTNSMDPVLDQGSNAIEIIPQSPDAIHVGDIISYENAISGGTIIHRVSEIGYDDNGWFAVTKGDNNPTADPMKVRFDDIQRLVVAIVY